MSNPLPKSEQQKLAHELTKKFVDQGKLIEAGFWTLRATAIRPDAPPVQIEEMRMAFMAGAEHLFGSIMSMLEPGSEPTEKDMNRMELIHAELEKFQAELKVRLAPKG